MHPLREVRVRRGFTQEQLAAASGLAVRTVQAVENDEGIPRRATAKVLALTLGCLPEDITRNDNGPVVGAAVREGDRAPLAAD
jgi:transcriptional regulator with XRE-family HTH domain